MVDSSVKNNNDAINRYITERVARAEIVPSSANVIRAVLRNWSRHVEHRPPPTWTVDDVAEWVHHTDVRATTRKSRLTKLRPFCRWLIIAGELGTDPTLEIARVRIPSPAPRDLTIAEVRLVYAACPDDRARLIVLIMAHMGLRAGDVARIRVEDIDTRNWRLHVRGKGGRGEPTHWVPIPTEAWSAIVIYITARSKVSGPLVRSYHPPHGPLTPGCVSKMVTGLMWDAGVKLSAWDGTASHSLRHSCAQHVLDAGGTVYDVQHTLGHSDSRTTETYLRREPPGLRDAIDGRSYAA